MPRLSGPGERTADAGQPDDDARGEADPPGPGMADHPDQCGAPDDEQRRRRGRGGLLAGDVHKGGYGDDGAPATSAPSARPMRNPRGEASSALAWQPATPPQTPPPSINTHRGILGFVRNT